MKRRRIGGRSAGQALVEFALIAPVFFLTFFGAIELSLIIASVGSYNFAVRDAARIGSLLGRTDPYPDVKLGGIIDTIRAHVSGIVMAKATEIDVYRAVSDGHCIPPPILPPPPPPIPPPPELSVDDPGCAKCVYSLTSTLQCTAGGTNWNVDNRNDSLENADYLGVRVLYQYTFLTGFVSTVGSTLSLSATSAQRIEPQDFQGSHSPGALAAQSAEPARSVGRSAQGSSAPALAAVSFLLWKPERARGGGL
jgi:hypothetical protein